jgi:replication-associated recombination protein RarA
MATATMTFPQTLADQYRPMNLLSDFIGLEKQRKMLVNLAARGTTGTTGILLHGGTGTGKTCCAFAFARLADCEIHHLPAQDCKLEELQRVADMCARYPYDWQAGRACKHHALIIDEADLLHPASQNFLLSRLDNSAPLPFTFVLLTCNSLERFEPRLLSRVITLPKFSGYGISAGVKDLLTRIWKERVPDAPMVDLDGVPTSSVREALSWLETELLSI